MPASKTKAEQIELIQSELGKSRNLILSTYTGMTVSDLAKLRGRLRENGLRFKVVKNNLFRIAWKKTTGGEVESGLDGLLHGQIGITFGGDNLPAAAKLLRDFGKEVDKLKVKGGYFEGQSLDPKGVESIAGLPTREEILAQIARGLNATSTSIARGMNEVTASLARAIKAVGEKNG